MNLVCLAQEKAIFVRNGLAGEITFVKIALIFVSAAYTGILQPLCQLIIMLKTLLMVEIKSKVVKHH